MQLLGRKKCKKVSIFSHIFPMKSPREPRNNNNFLFHLIHICQNNGCFLFLLTQDVIYQIFIFFYKGIFKDFIVNRLNIRLKIVIISKVSGTRIRTFQCDKVKSSQSISNLTMISNFFLIKSSTSFLWEYL